MLSGQIDVTGSSKVVWPVRDADIIALGESYLAFEQTRATALQLRDPDPHLVRQVLKSATTAAQAATSGEQARATSAVTYTQALEESKRLLDLALPQLKGKHVKNLAELQAYGLDTKNGARGGVLVARPTSDKGWIKFLVAYAEQEAALPQTDRIVDPRWRTCRTSPPSSRPISPRANKAAPSARWACRPDRVRLAAY